MEKTFIRRLEDWKLYLDFYGVYLVERPDGEIIKFKSKYIADCYILKNWLLVYKDISDYN